MTELESPYYYPRHLATPPSRFSTVGIVGITVSALILVSFIVFVVWRNCKAEDHNADQQDDDPQHDAAPPGTVQEVLSERSSAPENELDDGPAGAASISITIATAAAPC